MRTQKRLTRSNDKMIAGVLGGVAKYFDMDPTLVRILYVILSFLSAAFPGIIIYLIMWVVMPMEQPDQF